MTSTAILGKADWLYDLDLQVHIPCCTREITLGVEGQSLRKCGNGPLVGDAIESGDCGEHSGSLTRGDRG